MSAFKQAKSMISNSGFLTHYDSTLPIVVSADSSSYGIGACLAHKIDGKERPVCFASRTLTVAERKYSQLEREALALIFALKKFHFYIYGYKFFLKTDHCPLLSIFSPDRHIPVMASGRIQRWCLMLQAYNFDLIHTSGKKLGNVDCLSRLPVATVNESVPIPAEWINLVDFLDSTPITAVQIAKMIKKDKILSQVLHFCLAGWPERNLGEDFKPYSSKKLEISVQNDCLLWGSRIIIPSDARPSLLKELHSEHVGATRMKQLARSYFWWPNLDSDIEQTANSCSHCLEHRHMPPKTELHPWEWPNKVFHRVHIDYCGPMKDFYYLVIVDATSKWVKFTRQSQLLLPQLLTYFVHVLQDLVFQLFLSRIMLPISKVLNLSLILNFMVFVIPLVLYILLP